MLFQHHSMNKKVSDISTIAAQNVFAALTLALLSGCGLPGGQGVAPELAVPVPKTYVDQANAPVNQEDLASWWQNFDDPKLSDFMERTLAANNDLAEARANLASARASVRIARGGRLPSLSGGGSIARQESVRGNSGSSTGFEIGLDAAWETDIFGQLRATEESARANAQSIEASLHNVQRTLLAEVAFNFVDLREAQAQLAVTRRNLEIQNDNLQIARWRHQAGLVSALDVEQAKSLRDQTQARIPAFEQTIAAAIYSIDVLAGQNPGSNLAELSMASPIAVGPDYIATGLPAELLRRRPDIIAAERALAAESLAIGIAEADLYPQLRLSGSLTSSSLSLGGLVDTVVGNVIGSVTAPIFQGGQIRAEIDQQKANATAALAVYRGTVLTALEDVENALVAIKRSREQEATLMKAEQAAKETVRLSEISYRNGLSDFTVLLSAQQDLLNIQDSLTTATAARATAAVQLYKALGGGWTLPDAAPKPNNERFPS